jgi:hypothetical protein
MPLNILGPDTFVSATTGPGRAAPDMGVIITMTGVITGTGAVSGSVQLEGSNDGANWHSIGAAMNLSGTNLAINNAIRVQFCYRQYRANCTAISGTGATLVTHISVGS